FKNATKGMMDDSKEETKKEDPRP
ncbi:twin-arginine translocase TatA/TatE family subunit, partial [Listeria monocytogenes]|nr:twin-arginine translocase TatA/TatE family subunit [Listeria monocytogenes]